jgi:hypothetical protein
MLGIGLGPWGSRFICRLNMLFACKMVVPFPLSIGEILGYFITINYMAQAKNMYKAHKKLRASLNI